MEYLLALMAAGAVGWIWHTNLGVRELATRLARERCTETGAQFLDGTVAFTGAFPERRNGRVYLRRRYRFDFTDGSGQRFTGRVILVGQELDELRLYTGPVPH